MLGDLLETRRRLKEALKQLREARGRVRALESERHLEWARGARKVGAA